MTRSSVPQLLTDLVHYSQKILAGMQEHERTSDPHQRSLFQSAVMWNLIVLGEISIRLGDDFHAKHPEIPWRMIIAQRNFVAHGYDALNWERLLALREHHLDDLIKNARSLLSQYPPPPTEPHP